MADSQCATDLRELYTAIMDRAKGKGVTQHGHKDRSIAFANTSLADMLKLYRQLHEKCGAETDLPDLRDLNVSGRSGPALRARIRYTR